MTSLDEIPGNLLRKPSGEPENELERIPSDYKPLHSFRLDKDKPYKQQFADMYFLRLTKIKPAVEQLAFDAWEGKVIGDEPVKQADRVLDIRQGELCWVVGTVYMDMPLKPNILDDVSKDRWLSAPISNKKYYSEDGSDAVMLEDESGRVRLVGDVLNSVILVTGCIVAAMGTENSNGELEVIDLKFPDLPPQPDRWALNNPPATKGSIEEEKVKPKDEDTKMTDARSKGSGKKIAIVSGLGFSGSDASHAIELNLLLEYLLGESLDPAAQQELSQISRLIIAGNSISLEEREAIDEDMSEKKAHKKYGYDSSSYNAQPSQLLDEFLSTLLPTMPITLLPGAQDPANASYPQQSIHPAMFPYSRPYTAQPTSSEVGWFDTVTNPWEGEIEGWRVLGTGGQNVDDIFKYVGSDDRLGMMEAMCRWRCCAPTAPDTLWSYPFQDDDPFVMQTCPHLYFVGCQPEFGTKVIQGPDGQVVRLVAVPSFSATQEVVLIDTETLDVSKVKIVAV
ncbi:DNA polymerase alpha/epsilon subunit B-domain-containing protein [Annulohypoxylon maeteangense]|uniref:DNA polymerase alpha/epsilon subunit B-domain-containing protein n=1 Tax=Annulohypoxylon maeteangense TaxID=1927788 RepID=UPI002007CC67|nr:DNA polymerase alpha/epsilon subunit B-domain-containing protein [Annulohypoxylon maeteangense]KAI0883306.1 DNA polymerase alpha/epsilon subunit B-domain-containing protein [Annulohypoxylon maeteangense]